jgi:iron(III) transport system substrate-binding protein
MSLALSILGCSAQSNTLTVYSGRTESLIQPLLDQYAEETGVSVEVKYAKSSEIVALIQEEGSKSPADVVFLQDPSGLGVLSAANMLISLPNTILNNVDAKFRARNNDWVGTSGRARTVIYNTETIIPERDLPDSIMGFTDPKWKGRIGWAPTNGSFQAFVTAMRLQLGDEQTLNWLEGIQRNEPGVYSKNTPIVYATGNGEIDVGFVNHYYLYRFIAEGGAGFKARNHFLPSTDPGSMILVSGAGILKTSSNQRGAENFIGYLLGQNAQKYFTEETNEYPLVTGIKPNSNLDPPLPPLSQVNAPDADFSKLEDLEGTLVLLRKAGVLP